MKRLLIKIAIYFLALLMIMISAPVVLAEDAAPKVWKNIRETDSRVRDVEVTWIWRYSSPPGRNVNEQKLVAEARELSRLRGDSPAQIREEERIAHYDYKYLTAGPTAYSIFTLERQQDAFACQMTQWGGRAMPGPPSAAVHSLGLRYGDILIGISSVEGYRTPNASIERGSSHHIFSCPNQPGDLLLLAAEPILQSFPSDQTSIQPGPNDTVILENVIPRTPPQTPIYPLKAVVSSKTWRPTSIDVINWYNHKSRDHFDISGYKEYPGGIWFPSQIVEVDSGGDRNVFSLVTAKFNSQTQLPLLSRGIPPRTVVDDLRFKGKTIRYWMGDHLPTDAEALALWNKQQSRRAGTPAPAGLPLLFGGLLVGVVLVRIARRRRIPSNKSV